MAITLRHAAFATNQVAQCSRATLHTDNSNCLFFTFIAPAQICIPLIVSRLLANKKIDSLWAGSLLAFSHNCVPEE